MPVLLGAFALAFYHHAITQATKVFTLSPLIRLNFTISFTWAAAVILAYLIASRTNLWMGLFLILASFSAYYPDNTDYSEKAYQFIFYGMIWYYACVEIIKTDRDIDSLLNLICITTLIHCAIIILQDQGINVLRTVAEKPRYSSIPFDPVPNVGIMDSFHTASSLIAISLPAFFRRRWVWFIILPVAGFILTRTFGGPMAAGAVLCIWVFTKLRSAELRFWFIVAVPVVLLAYATFVDVPDPSWRWMTWKFAVTKLYPQVWIIGFGVGHWEWVFSRPDVVATSLKLHPLYSQIMAQAHNEYVQGLLEMGIPFIVVITGYVITTARRLTVHSLLPALGVVACAVNALVTFPFHIALLAMLGLTWMAILENTLKPSSFSSRLQQWSPGALTKPA